jgi:type II secretory pathway component PulC|tara:strand:- start:41 stop:253 length:213 start_codon:yes stop_codon:yes gene_type:complete
MEFVVSKAKDMLVIFNQGAYFQQEYVGESPKAYLITVKNISKDTVLLETDSLDEVVKLVNEYDKHKKGGE